MKYFLQLALVLAANCVRVSAGEYGPVATVWTASSITNATGIATNVGSLTGSAVVPVTQTAEFTLQFVLGFTNACAGSYDVQWSTSASGVSFASAPAMPGASGWFSIPLTNGGAVVTWVTNFNMSSCGYWKLNFATNQAGQSLTNASVIAYMKPKRTNKDY